MNDWVSPEAHRQVLDALSRTMDANDRLRAELAACKAEVAAIKQRELDADNLARRPSGMELFALLEDD